MTFTCMVVSRFGRYLTAGSEIIVHVGDDASTRKTPYDILMQLMCIVYSYAKQIYDSRGVNDHHCVQCRF